jgi:hypothetical protein
MAGGRDTALEEKSRNGQTSTVLPDTLHYKAVGWVKWQYLPSSDNFTTGILLLEDGVVASANLLVSASRFLKNRKDLLENSQVWIVYPHTRPKDPPYFHFTIRGISLPESKSKLEDFVERVDSFQVDGLVIYGNSETKMLVVRIYRNTVPSTANCKNKYETVTLYNLQQERQNRQALIDKVRNFWVRGVLAISRLPRQEYSHKTRHYE